MKNTNPILSKLDNIIIGHKEAKKAIMTSLYRASLRSFQKHWLNMPFDKCISNKNILLIGDSGTGKTLLIDEISKILNLPLVKFTATELSLVGCENGIDAIKAKKIINKRIEEFYEISQNSIDVFTETQSYTIEEVRDRTVIFIDEIDKICLSLGQHSNWNRHIQYGLLKLIENKDDYPSLTFIFAGAFVGLKKSSEIINPLGFTSSTSISSINKKNMLDEELIKYGLVPEFLGRIQSINLLDSFSKKEYKEILLTKIIPKKEKELELLGIKKFSVTPKNIDDIVNTAIKSNQGIRSLTKQVEDLALELEFDSMNHLLNNSLSL